ncbi:hypothetical protein B0H14DRAFT_3140509 [Mycena olivaceomarginata]|nr:hypothetical protein B0H14DRAFT_3157652 [Mycena olivaceomarginata]KAJ7840380.1 hypothetical protein B0H14DRAFT_3140509 [Mycena olivaceomarginata]
MDSQYYDSVNLSCNYCGMKRSKGRIKACQCQMRFYCSASSCQKEDWDEHKAHCTPYVERDPCWVKWFPARRVFWQAVMGAVPVGQVLFCVAITKGNGVEIAGAGIGVLSLHKILPDIWSNQIHDYVNDSTVRLAIVMSFKTVRILPFRVGTGEGALDKKYTLASFLEHVNSGIKIAVVRKFRDERN